MFDSEETSAAARPRRSGARWLPRIPRFPQFSPEQEQAFRAHFVAAGRRHKSELWLILLFLTGFLAVFHRFFLTDPETSAVVVPLVIIGTAVPAVLRWLSGAQSPWHRWSTALYVISVYADVACLMAIRAISIDNGHDLIPILLPVGVLTSLLVANVRSTILLPTVFVGFAGIAAIELTLIPTTSNGLFNLVASAGILLVPLLSSYELERLNRVAWLQKQELRTHARTDALTGLPNRRGFSEAFRDALGDRADASAPFPLALIDLDSFKQLNDTLGHPTGDLTLALVGRFLLDDSAAHGSPGETVARLSGEEFVVFWPGLDGDEAKARAEALRSGIGALGLPTGADGPAATLTASAGFVCRTVPHDDPELAARQLVACADTALYGAKETGRDRLVVNSGPVPATVAHWPRPPESSSETATDSQARTGPPRFAPALEARFLDYFERTGIPLRRTISGGIMVFSALIFLFQDQLLLMPPEASLTGRMFLATAIIPGAAIAFGVTYSRRLRGWSSYIYVVCLATVISAQMIQRVIQLPKGYDVVPFLMPLAVLLSLGIVQIRFRLLAPAMLTVLVGLVTTEAVAFSLTPYRVLNLIAAVAMALVVLRFAYRLEKASRDDWSRSQSLYRLSRIDTLTGLPNRRAFDDDLAAGAETPHPASHEVRALMLIDVDHLKRYNDRYGHPAGDVYLETVAQAVVTAVGTSDRVYRVGGDEFAVLLSGTDAAALAEQAESVVTHVRTIAVPDSDSAQYASVSAGFAILSDAGSDDVDRMVTDADEALYAAKQQGRGRAVGAPERAGPN